MSDEMNNEIVVNDAGAPRWVWLAMVALAVVSLVGLGVGWNATMHAKAAEQALAAQNQTLQQNADSLATLTQRLAASEQTSTQLHSDLTGVTENLKNTQGQLTTARRQTTQIRDEYSKK